jgi:hypothetical protein
VNIHLFMYTSTGGAVVDAVVVWVFSALFFYFFCFSPEGINQQLPSGSIRAHRWHSGAYCLLTRLNLDRNSESAFQPVAEAAELLFGHFVHRLH